MAEPFKLELQPWQIKLLYSLMSQLAVTGTVATDGRGKYLAAGIAGRLRSSARP